MVEDSGKQGHSGVNVSDEEIRGEHEPDDDVMPTDDIADAAQLDDEPLLPDDPIERLEMQLTEALRSAESFKDQLYRKAAELENTKRRLNRQMDEVRTYGTMEVLRELLPVIDDLERAIQHAQQRAHSEETGSAEPVVSSMLDGIGMVAKKFITTLERFGLKGFDSVGEAFDPQIHEAINSITTTDYPDGTVIEEFLRGYMLKDRLIRPAVVVVARNPSGSE